MMRMVYDSNPGTAVVAPGVGMVAVTLIVLVFAFAYFQISNAIKDTVEEDSPAREIVDETDETVEIVFPWLIPGALSILLLVLALFRFFR